MVCVGSPLRAVLVVFCGFVCLSASIGAQSPENGKCARLIRSLSAADEQWMEDAYLGLYAIVRSGEPEQFNEAMSVIERRYSEEALAGVPLLFQSFFFQTKLGANELKRLIHWLQRSEYEFLNDRDETTDDRFFQVVLNLNESRYMMGSVGAKSFLSLFNGLEMPVSGTPFKQWLAERYMFWKSQLFNVEVDPEVDYADELMLDLDNSVTPQELWFARFFANTLFLQMQILYQPRLWVFSSLSDFSARGVGEIQGDNFPPLLVEESQYEEFLDRLGDLLSDEDEGDEGILDYGSWTESEADPEIESDERAALDYWSRQADHLVEIHRVIADPESGITDLTDLINDFDLSELMLNHPLEEGSEDDESYDENRQLTPLQAAIFYERYDFAEILRQRIKEARLPFWLIPAIDQDPSESREALNGSADGQ